MIAAVVRRGAASSSCSCRWFGYDLGGPASDVAEELGVTVPDIDTSVDFNAWESLASSNRPVRDRASSRSGSAIAAAMARDVGVPVAASAIVAGLGILSLVLVAYRLARHALGVEPQVRASSSA